MKITTEQSVLSLTAEDLPESLVVERIGKRWGCPVYRNKSGRALSVSVVVERGTTAEVQEVKDYGSIIEELTTDEKASAILFIEGHTTDDIAKIMSVCPRTAFARLASVRKKLKAKNSYEMAYILGTKNLLRR